MAFHGISISQHINEDWEPISMETARYLRVTTEKSDIAMIAAGITSKRVVGEGVHFDMIGDTEDSQSAMREMQLSTTDGDEDAPNAGQQLLKHAGRKRMQGNKRRVGEGVDSIPLDDLFSAVRVEWNAFVEELDGEIMRQGFALVLSRPSEYHPELLVPYIEDIDYYRVYQRHLPLVGKQYLAVWDQLSSFQEKQLGVRNGTIIENALFLVGPSRFAPDNKGQLCSKLFAVAPLIAEIEAMEENISYSLYWSTHPPWVPQLGPTGPGSAKGAASAAAARISAPPYANYTQLIQDKSAQDRFNRAQKLDDAEEMHEDAYKRLMGYQLGKLYEKVENFQAQYSHVNARARAARDGNQRHAMDPPFMREYPVEQGDTVTSGPSPTLPTQIRENKNDLTRRAYLGLDVQPQLVTLEHSNHAANSDIAFAGQNEAILNRQHMLEPLLAKAFRFVYHIELAQVDLLEEKSNPKGELVAQHSCSQIRTRMIDDAGMPSRIGHRIRARLCGDPLTTASALENMLKTHVLDHDTYKEMMLKSACVSTHLASRDKVDFDQVDMWYGNVKSEPADSSVVGSARKIDGKPKKRSASSLD